MLALQNHTPYEAVLVPGLDKAGTENVTLVVKATFAIKDRAEKLALAEEQVPYLPADVFHGKDPATSSLKYGSDAAPQKRGTDVALLGHAWAPEPVAFADVRLSVGPVHKVVRVFGDRVWQGSMAGPRISEPAKFTRMPLLHELAFGGADRTDPEQVVFERRNPVGKGFFASAVPARTEGRPLPNLEDPEHLIASPLDRPRPTGFGLVARSWLPRAKYAGTYDAAWREERCPFLPADFDERFFHAAQPDLISSKPLSGGEEVVVSGVSPAGDIHFRLPALRLRAAFVVRGERAEREPALDTVLIEPDAKRLVLAWRITEPCPRTFLYIESVALRETARAA